MHRYGTFCSMFLERFFFFRNGMTQILTRLTSNTYLINLKVNLATEFSSCFSDNKKQYIIGGVNKSLVVVSSKDWIIEKLFIYLKYTTEWSIPKTNQNYCQIKTAYIFNVS